ncbi:DUF4399 domain-containing protein [Eoetvoesia caeni]|nr:DUF4399 domain-containing protein [Eoetvoesiella caeni]MCI2809928.1 DUF4399 domain-containing protein [Eoetvoesiella caeni]
MIVTGGAALLLASGAMSYAAEGRAFLIAPTDGATVSSPFAVKFGVEGKTVAPAGDQTPNSGHNHLIIDGGSVPAGQVIPADSTHLHFGKGQTETELTLPKGKHTLTTQFADYSHKSFGPEWSQTITITVQ